MKEGDIVVRKSYNKDIIFKIIGFSKDENNKKVAVLKGVAFRLIADAYLDDLELVKEKDMRGVLIDKNVQNLLYRSVVDARERQSFYRGVPKLQSSSNVYGIPGKVLQIDGDKEYLKICLDVYTELGIPAVGVAIPEANQYKEVRGDNNLYVENIEVLEKNTPIVVSLYKNFTLDVIKDIYNYCLDKKQDKINFSKLGKIRRFVQLENQRRKKKLDFPILKFLQDTKEWVNEHQISTKQEIENYQKTYAAKYANFVKDVVVDDVNYLEEIYAFVQDLWSVVVIQNKPKDGNIKLEMFELLWENREDIDLKNIYGDDSTKLFFSEQLLNSMKPEDDEESAPELSHTSKLRLNDVENDLTNVVHTPYDYYEYSKLDGSNNRFMRKQENTQSQFIPTTESPTNAPKTDDMSLFSQEELRKIDNENLPF